LPDRVTGTHHFDVSENAARVLEALPRLPGYLVPRLSKSDSARNNRWMARDRLPVKRNCILYLTTRTLVIVAMAIVRCVDRPTVQSLRSARVYTPSALAD
jgi:hypothetical protein